MPGHVLFFPTAAAYAAVVLPASVASMLGLMPALPGLAFPAGHAHELLFGFGLAAVAGNQLGPTPLRSLAPLFVAWLAARIAFLAQPEGLFAAVANAAFAGLLALQLAPRLLIRARKMRNRALPVTLVVLCASAAAMQVALHVGSVPLQRGVLVVAVLLFSLLMLFMGGRIIAPAAAGQIYKQGGDLAARVQPRIEGASIVAMLAAVVAASLARPAWAGAACLVASLLAWVRMARWRLWKLEARPDLACLAAGYAWLALGLAALGLALLLQSRLVTAIHVITVGAMGTLTVNVMALTFARLSRRDLTREWLPVASTVLIAAATASRIAADFGLADPRALLIMAAACWCAAYVLLLGFFARRPGSPTRRPGLPTPRPGLPTRRPGEGRGPI